MPQRVIGPCRQQRSSARALEQRVEVHWQKRATFLGVGRIQASRFGSMRASLRRAVFEFLADTSTKPWSSLTSRQLRRSSSARRIPAKNPMARYGSNESGEEASKREASSGGRTFFSSEKVDASPRSLKKWRCLPVPAFRKVTHQNRLPPTFACEIRTFVVRIPFLGGARTCLVSIHQ